MTMPHNPVRSSIFIVISVFMLTLSTYRSGAAPPVDSDPVTLLLVPFLTHAPLFIAHDEGYFEDSGLQVDVVEMHRPTTAFPLLLRGEIDVMGSVIHAGFFNAAARGANVKAVAGMAYVAEDTCTHLGVLARKDLIRNDGTIISATLKDSRVSLIHPSLFSYFFDTMLVRHGMGLGDVRIVDIGQAGKIDAFEKGLLDFSTAGEPWLTRHVQSGFSQVFCRAEDVLPDFQFSMILFGEKLLRSDSDRGQRFIAAYLRAVQQYVLGKTDRNVDILSRHTHQSPEIIRKACWPAVRQTGELNIASLLDYQAWLLNSGYVDKVLTKGQIHDARFIESAGRQSPPTSETH